MTLCAAEKKRLTQLRILVEYHRKRYHEEDNSEISDEAYDSLVRELGGLELRASGTRGVIIDVVGGAPNAAFTKVIHEVRQWSFDNVFSANELCDWEAKLLRHFASIDIKPRAVTYVAEHKIDGLKLVLTYQTGRLVRAVTRGDGVTGEDVTHTAVTIKTIPRVLTQPVDLICVGEVWLGKKEFECINQERAAVGESLFANPRNVAAGSLRQLDPMVAKQRRLSYFAYDVDRFEAKGTKFIPPRTQLEELTLLDQLGLPTNPYAKRCTTIKAVVKYYNTWMTKHHDLPYGVDGVVVKVDDIALQTAVGYTAKAPRFGIAFKFPAAQTTTEVENISLQVGRTGVVTPVAHLRPVTVAGSTVARATLHNEDQIKRLNVRVGDTVVLQKAGDVIPEIVSVISELRPLHTHPYRFPKIVPGCGGDGAIKRVPGEVAYRCVVLESDYLRRQKLYYFVSKAAFNIDGIGPRIIDALLAGGIITHHFDLFNCTTADFLLLDGFKERAAENAVAAITKAKVQSLTTFLVALSIDQIGEETARLIAEHFGSLDRIRNAHVDDVAVIHGVGEAMAGALVAWFADPVNQRAVDELLKYITISESTVVCRETLLSGQTVVVTGTLTTMSRDEVKAALRRVGAKVASSVSKQTNYVVVGKDAGSKADTAKKFGIPRLSETELRKFLA